MEARDVLSGQLETLAQELDRCRTAIDSPQIDPLLRTRVAARLDQALTRLEDRHESLSERASRNDLPAEVWADFHTLRSDAAKLFDECLAFIQGAFARAHGLDEGLCTLTDNLLDDIAVESDLAWGRFTLLATSELYRHTAQIIRIRYPELSFWSLPLAAHEFGHYAGPLLRTTGDEGQDIWPFQERLKEAGATRGNALHSREWQYLQEYFADVFATYTLGPAYAAAFVLLRANPQQAYAESLTHPTFAARIHGILRTLEKMNGRIATDLDSPLSGVTALLREVWQNTLTAAGQSAALAAPSEALVTQRIDTLLEMLIGTTPQRLQFGRAEWLRVQGAASHLLAKKDPAAMALKDLTRREVVNAAWLARLRSNDPSPRAIHDLGRSASALYRRLPERP